MIEFQQACFSFGTRTVIHDLTLSLVPGGFHFVTGPSGSGKTTFIRLCGLEIAPTSGSVLFRGQKYTRRDRNAAADLRKMIGIVPQDCQFLDHLSVLENIALPLDICGLDVAARSEDLTALLEWVDLSDRTQDKPNELSGGERQLAAVARAVINSPDLILADEPTGGLDREMALRLLALLVELNRTGKTIVVASCDQSLVEEAAERATIEFLQIAEGRLVSSEELE